MKRLLGIILLAVFLSGCSVCTTNITVSEDMLTDDLIPEPGQIPEGSKIPSQTCEEVTPGISLCY